MTKKLHFDGVVEAAGARIGAARGGVLAEVFGEHPEGNARRLAASWNLCQGIDTETLEALGISALLRLHGATVHRPEPEPAGEPRSRKRRTK